MPMRALREIPDDVMKKHGWKTKLGGDDSDVKLKIFGQNSAKIYKYKITAEIEQQIGHDKLATMKAEYQREGMERNNRYYGYIGKKTMA